MLSNLFKRRTPAAEIVKIFVVDYNGYYRVEFNFGGTYYVSVRSVQVEPEAPSKLYGYEGWTAEDAYQHRQVHHLPTPGGVGWINLRETEPLTTLALVEKAIAKILEKRKGQFSEVVREDVSLVEYMRLRRKRF